MNLALRSKLLLIVATTGLSFAFIVVIGMLTSARQSDNLTELENRLVPQLELAPRIETSFTKLTRGFQDAVAAQDMEALRATAQTRDAILKDLQAAHQLLDPDQHAALNQALAAYYSAAYDVSRRMIEGETGERILSSMSDMQAKQETATQALQNTLRLDRSRLSNAFSVVRAAIETTNRYRIGTAVLCLALVGLISLWFLRGAVGSLRQLSSGLARFATGDFDQPVAVRSQDELGEIARVANHMADSLRHLNAQRATSDWIKEGLAGLSIELRGELEPTEAAQRALRFLLHYVGAQVGALYLAEDDGGVALRAAYALDGSDPTGQATARFRPGEGLIGESVGKSELRIIHDLPEGYLSVRSGLGQAAPTALALLPLSRLGKAVGVVELALLKDLSDEARELLTQSIEPLSIALDAARSRAALRTLLEQTTEQARRLTQQEEELKVSNQELAAQQEELRQVNEELEEQRRALFEQNTELEEARERLQVKAEELGKMSSYKSQFLANMSHELRTPLNSMLLLSQLLADNEDANLSPKQVEYCRTINSAGRDLLSLINQVLDLAKIEAGKQEVEIESVELRDLTARARRAFTALAKDKGLLLETRVDDDVPAAIATDRQRLERILTNLLANAIKFTPSGSVTLRVSRAPRHARFSRSELKPETTLAFAVTDTGIGVAPEARDKVFAPFEQVDARPDRRYGGTGLGLAIARESAALLGGELTLESEIGQGSTFTVFLPISQPARTGDHPEVPATKPEDTKAPQSSDAVSSRTLLVIEDDPVFAERLMDLIRNRQLDAVWARSGEEGLRLAREAAPRGIILDLALPDIDGWTILERLSKDDATRSIPVHVISALDSPERSRELGAVGYLAKPATKEELIAVVQSLAPPNSAEPGKVLLVEDNADEARAIVALLEHEKLSTHHVTTVKGALEAFNAERFDCMVLDLGLPDGDGLVLLENLANQSERPLPSVVVHTARSLTREETRRLEAYAQAVVLKDGNSAQRLLEEVRLFVQHVRDRLPDSRPPAAATPLAAEISLSGHRILVADDDMRTVYAVSALLRGKGAEVLVAETGREAVDLLTEDGKVDGVLMDIMMPEMDGYEAMRILRRDARFAQLPLIALTAKAMKGERERCLAAGASDYVSKPVDSAELLSVLKAQLDARGSNEN